MFKRFARLKWVLMAHRHGGDLLYNHSFIVCLMESEIFVNALLKHTKLRLVRLFWEPKSMFLKPETLFCNSNFL